ncbi:hotdog domain-containing protein, partial [Staphylococcus aureus]|nr:hotdog domain-containing protein [Staphylococcus aureus]
PVRVGDILSFYSSVQRVGRTSVTVDVEVYAERFADQGRFVKVTEALLTYVAIDAQGKPQSLPDNEQVRSWRASAERTGCLKMNSLTATV